MSRRRHRHDPGLPEGPYVHADALHVQGLEHGKRWIVKVYEEDPTPISVHSTRAEAETAARAHALAYGYKHIVVHELDGDETVLDVGEPRPQPPYPGGVRGAPAG